MQFNIWRIWLGSKPWSLKWFVYLVLLRPVIDNFYYLKNISPVLSPLYWVGLLTPIMCIPAIFKYRYNNNLIHRLFNIWSFLIILNTFFIFFQNLDLITVIQWLLRLSMPVYLFFFIRVFLKNKTDLIGLLTTFLYASGLAAIMLLYELIFKPIRLGYSRGIERISGGYADVMNYAIYLSFGFLILLYFYISYKSTRQGLKIKLPSLIGAGIFCMAGYISISHTSSYAVFAALLILFVTSISRKYTSVSFVIILIFWVVLFFYGDKFYQERIDPLVGREVEIIKGGKPETQLFHGRMARWQFAWAQFGDASITTWLLGYPTSLENPIFHISIGIHNDYLRIFYFTGIIGLVVYIFFLYKIWSKKKFSYLPDKFLLNGCLVILLLYSVSTTPTFYANFLYILLTICVYFALPPAFLVRHGQN
jgi:hypothetical protein